MGIEDASLLGPDGSDQLWTQWIGGSDPLPDRWSAYAPLRNAAKVMADRLLGSDAGLVLATTKGDIDGEIRTLRSAEEADGPHREQVLASAPTLGAQAAYFAPGRPAWTVSTACSSGLVALVDAACALLEGEAGAMVALGIDLAGDFVRQGFHALKAISPTACRPFDRERDGLALGSAAAACRLSLKARPACILSGWGLASDATHMTAPDRDAGGLVRAMRQALRCARLRPADIDVLFAHGTGTRYNDAMEAAAVDAVFRPTPGDRGPAITAVKGLIGHTLGASGLVEAVLGMKMLEMQVVPPIVGLRSPEREDLDFVRSVRPMKIDHLMKVASGFGGLNVAIILSRPAAWPSRTAEERP